MYSPFVNTGSKINGQIARGGEHPDGESAENRQRREGGKQEAFSKQCHVEFSFCLDWCFGSFHWNNAEGR